MLLRAGNEQIQGSIRNWVEAELRAGIQDVVTLTCQKALRSFTFLVRKKRNFSVACNPVVELSLLHHVDAVLFNQFLRLLLRTGQEEHARSGILGSDGPEDMLCHRNDLVVKVQEFALHYAELTQGVRSDGGNCLELDNLLSLGAARLTHVIDGFVLDLAERSDLVVELVLLDKRVRFVISQVEHSDPVAMGQQEKGLEREERAVQFEIWRDSLVQNKVQFSRVLDNFTAR